MPGSRLREPRYVAGLGVLVVIGVAALLIQAWHVFGEPAMTVPELLLGVLVPSTMGIALLAYGGWVHRQRIDPNEMLAIGSWAGMGFLVFGWVGAGAMLYYLVQDSPLYDPIILTFTIGSAGALAGSILGLYDVRVRQARESFRSQRDRAEQLSERLSILNRVFRHDIRTELTVIKGHAQLARERGDPAVEHHLETIADRAQAIERRSEQARTLQTTIDQATSKEIQDVSSLVRSLTEKLEGQYPDASFDVAAPERTLVRASVELEAAIEELLINAIEHGKRQGIEIRVKGKQDTVEIVVRNDGPGIPESEVEIIESARESPLDHSSGMGLWTVKWVIEASDGTVEIEAADPGTRVTIELPRAERD